MVSEKAMTTPARESSIDYNLNRLEDNLNRYSELMDMLNAKIDRVLGPDFEDSPGDTLATDPGNSGIGSSIGSKAIHLEILNDKLQRLIKRVDL